MEPLDFENIGEMVNLQDTNQIFVGSIPANLTREGLMNHFGQYGTIVDIITHPGFAFISFSTKREASSAVEAPKRTRPFNVKVEFARPRRPFLPTPPECTNDAPRHDVFKLPIKPTVSENQEVRRPIQVPPIPLSDLAPHRSNVVLRTVSILENNLMDEEFKECYGCSNLTDKFCKRCGTHFCSTNCMKLKADYHVSFCQTLVVPVPVQPKPLTRPPLDANMLAITDGRESGFSGGTDNFINTGARDRRSFTGMYREGRGRQSLPSTRLNEYDAGGSVYPMAKPPPGSRFKPQVPPPNPTPLGYRTRFNVKNWRPTGQMEANVFNYPPPREGGRKNFDHLTPSGAEVQFSIPEKVPLSVRMNRVKLGRANKHPTESSTVTNSGASPSNDKRVLPSESYQNTSNTASPTEEAPRTEQVPFNLNVPPPQEPEAPKTTESRKEKDAHGPKEACLPPAPSSDRESCSAGSCPAVESYFKVSCLYPENDGWWVLPESNDSKFDKVCETLAIEKVATLPTNLVATGLLCAARFEGSWWRVKVVTTVPQLVVHYVDYGNTEICQSGDLRMLPSGLEDIPPLAFFIKFAHGTSSKYTAQDLMGTDIRICVVGESGETKIVKVQDCKVQGDALPVSEQIIGATAVSPTENRSNTAVPLSQATCSHSSTAPPLVAKSALVMSEGPAKPVRIGMGCTPPSAISPPESVARAEPLLFPPSVPPPVQRLPSGVSVAIQFVHSECEVSVTSTDEEETYTALMNKVADICLKEKAPSELPAPGSIVGALFDLDEVFYRGSVICHVDGKAKVFFIDYGNEQLTPLSQLRLLPEHVQSVPPAAVTVRLRDVPPCDSLMARLHLDSLVQKEVTLKYEDGLFRGVELIDDQGKSVNQQVVDRINTKEASPEDAPASIGVQPDIYNTIVLSDGIKEQLMLSYYDTDVEENGKIYCVDVGEAMTKHVLGAMMRGLQEYSKNLNMPAYRPRHGEICSAFFPDDAGEWLRAFCQRTVDTTSSELFFIDFGNTAIMDHAHIRPLADQFKSPPGIAVLCKIKGIKRATTEEKKRRIKKAAKDLCIQQDFHKVEVRRKGSETLVAFPLFESILSEA